jgi:hypothetical protein
MALAVIDFHVSFALHTATKKFIFSDLTDYAGQSVALADANGILKIVDPDGTVVYENLDYGSADIDLDVSRIDTAAVAIPLDSSGNPKSGTYTFTYSVKDNNDATIVVKEKTFDYSYVAPSIDISITADCLTPNLKSVDTTGYTVDGVTPSNTYAILAADAGSNFFTIDGNYTGLFTVSETFYVTGSTGNDNSGAAYTITSVVYDAVNDETDIYVASVADGTADGSITTRIHKIYYPASLELASTNAHTSTLSVNSFYTGTQTSSIAITQHWEYSNEISIVDDFSATEEHDVDCDQRLCDIYCSLISVYDKWQENKSTNLILANAYRDRLVGALPLLTLLKEAFECGKDDKIDSIKADIYEISGSSADCSCKDGDPVPIKGVGAAATTVVDSSGSGLTVSTSVLGDVTTYTVALDSTTYARINNAYNTRVLAGTNNVTITESDVDASNVKTFTVSVDDNVAQPDFSPGLDFSVDLTFTGSAVTIGTVSSAISSPSDWVAFQVPTVSDANLSLPSYQNLDVNIKVADFGVTDLTTNYVLNHSHELIQTPESLVGSTQNLTGGSTYRGLGFYPIIHSKGNNEFYLTFSYGDIAKIADNGNMDGAIIRMFFSLRATPASA